MMPLGLSTSISVSDSSVNFSKGTKNSAVNNDESGKKFTHALEGQGNPIDESARHDNNKLRNTSGNNDAGHSLLEDVLNVSSDKDGVTVAVKQNIFIAFNNVMNEDFSSGKLNQSKGEAVDSLTIDADGSKKGVMINSGDKEVFNIISEVNKKTSKLNGELGKVSSMGEDGLATKATVFENKSITNSNRRFNEVNSAMSKDGAVLTERATERTIERPVTLNTGAEKDTEKSIEKGFEKNPDKVATNSQSNTALKSEFAAAKVSVKSVSNQTNFLVESKIENLGNTFQQIVTATETKSETKSGATIETVSTPRSVVNFNQSVVPLKTIEIQLLPKALGLIQVKIEMAEGKMTLMVETQTAKAEAAIRQESAQIIEAVKAAGMSVEELSIRRNVDLNQQDQAIRDFTSDADQQQNFAKKGEFSEQFAGQNETTGASEQDLVEQKTGALDHHTDSRLGVYL